MRPRLELSTAKLNLGDGKPNEVLHGELTLTNRGPGTAKFSLIRHCGCTELSPLAGELEPGGDQTICVGVQLPGYANLEKSTSVEVQSGEPAEIVARCVLAARCPAPFQVTPAFISFGSLNKAELARASHEVRVESVTGRPPMNAATLLIEHAGDTFRVERASSPAAQSVVLRVTLKSDLRPGDLYDTLSLRLRDSDQVMRVPLHATLVEAISVVPSTVALRKGAEPGAYKPVELLVIARAGRELRGTVSIAEGPKGLRIRDLGEVGRGRRRLRLSVIGDGSRWPHEGQVWLKCGRDTERFGFKVVEPST